ncbi:MAG TPA: hypothetical protein VGO01_22300 [Bradyrhizobium sp.]|nr:hypothetical protein [Bradyrhizobium sp.]
MLIVAPSESDLAEVSRAWSSAGWSVARFTHQKMLKMADRGSLFLQHLKLEGLIVKDDDGFLASVLDQYRPKQEYENELHDSFGLLSDLSRLPSSYWPTLCSADIAYVAIRNIAILRFASRGIYTFDYSDLVEQLAHENSISAAKLHALRHLRILKHGYRNRLTKLCPWRVLEDALECAEDLFGQSCCAQPQNRFSVSGYRGLRMLERYLVMKADPRFLDRLPAHDPLATAWALIRDPRDYPKIIAIDDAWIQRIRLSAESRFAPFKMTGQAYRVAFQDVE